MALLIAAVVVVALFFVGLPVLFSMGAFNAGSPVASNTCIAYVGYICTNITYSAGYIKVSLGQSTGMNWNQATVVAEGYNSTAYTVPPTQLFTTQSAVQIPGGLPYGQVATVSIPVNKEPTSGVIWAQYAASNSTKYAEIASFIITSKNN
jgi:hypothetical protein